MQTHQDVLDLANDMKARGEAFALATVVRTVSVTAAKAGAKAVIRADGSISGGWIGGGCARGAVLKAARAAIADGQPRLVSIQPKDLLDELGVKPGEARDLPVLRNGNVATPGEIVPRHFLTVLSKGDSRFQKGSGRLELGERIFTDAAPLAARVIVNRVWDWHFGRPLAPTPSDFGVQGEKPIPNSSPIWLPASSPMAGR